MSLLRQRIITSAMRFFAEKGYGATSIQDIANDCAIAKGSLYKIFSSKEDLLIDVFEVRFQRMREQVELIRNDSQATPMQRLARETLLQLEFFAEFKFNMQDFQEIPLQGDSKLGMYVASLRAKLMNYYAECLVLGFGKEVEPYKWDLISIFVGMMKQYTVFGYFLKSPIDPNRISSYIVDRMEDITAGILLKKPKPLLEASMVELCLRQSQEEIQNSTEKLKADLLQQFDMAIQELAIPLSSKSELLDALNILREQLEEEHPRTVIVRAMLDFLAKQQELASYAGQLERILDSEKRSYT
jgi:AcrR family transcriptional regulator